jgi:chloramphenicol 3-O-phosphotransferase
MPVSRRAAADNEAHVRRTGTAMTGSPAPAILLLTGISAAGKSTVAQLLAERLPRSVHLRGDLFRRMIVRGRADVEPHRDPEADRQLRLRYRLAAAAADGYHQAGFTVVMQDVVLGPHLAELVATIRGRRLMVVVLAPRPDVVAARERARAKTGYASWTVEQLDDRLRRHTPRIGLWLDTSDQTPDETASEILRRAWTEASVP